MRNVRRAVCALLLALPFCGMAQGDIIASWNGRSGLLAMASSRLGKSLLLTLRRR